MKNCNCNDWKKNRPILDMALVMYHNHGCGQLKKTFNFCPYCGIKLKESKK